MERLRSPMTVPPGCSVVIGSSETLLNERWYRAADGVNSGYGGYTGTATLKFQSSSGTSPRFMKIGGAQDSRSRSTGRSRPPTAIATAAKPANCSSTSLLSGEQGALLAGSQ